MRVIRTLLPRDSVEKTPCPLGDAEMNPGRNLHRAEIISPTSSSRRQMNPKGIPSFSPGLPASARATLGNRWKNPPTLKGLHQHGAGGRGCNPFRVAGNFADVTQGRRVRANPGLSDAIPSGLNVP